MEKIIQTLINSWTKGVDTYTHNGSTWLIFTDNKQWVIELTDSKTLWYNYNFFKQIFEFTSLDVVDNQQYITKWVEDNVIGGGAKETQFNFYEKQLKIEGVIKNGSIDCVRVNEHSLNYVSHQRDCEDTIKNGIKETSHNATMFQSMKVEDTIKNGVKETITSKNRSRLTAENIIENGVRHTEIGWHQCNNIDDTIEKGVKETIELMNELPNKVKKIIKKGVKLTQFNDNENKSWIEGVIKKGVRHTLNTEYMPTSMVEDIIQSGVKHTEYGDWLDGDERLDDIVENGVKKTSLKHGTRPFMVKDTINNGVKETNPVDVMKFFDNKMEDALQNGVKETKSVRGKYFEEVHDVLENGVKETHYDTNNYTDDVKEVIKEGVRTSHPRQFVGEKMIDKVIDKGVMETHEDVYHHKGRIDGVIKNGIKETKTPGNGDIVSTVEWMKENNSNSYPKMIDDVIDNGEKINGTYAGGQRQSIKCKSVVEYGTKNPSV